MITVNGFGSHFGGGSDNEVTVEDESAGWWKAAIPRKSPGMASGVAQEALVGRSRSHTGYGRHRDRTCPQLGRFVNQLDSRQLQRAGQREHGSMLRRRYEDRPMIAAGKARWPNQVPIAALLVCSALVTAACTTSTSIADINGACNGQGASNAANCTSQGNSAVGSTSAADSAAGRGSAAKPGSTDDIEGW